MRIPIAFVMTSFEPGGTERQMIELLRRLDPDGWTVHVACFHARGTWFGRVAQAAASVQEFPVETFRRLDVVSHVRAFARWCRQRRIAVVHTTELYSNVFGLPGAALARVPVRIANRRELNPDKTPPQIAMQRAAYSLAHKVIANSRAAADRLAAERVPARKIAVVPNGLDLTAYRPRRVRGALRRVVVVANLRREKGHDVLLDAAVEIARRHPDAHFEFVGAGPERDRLAAQAARLGLTRAVAFRGHCDDVPGRLAEADLFVLPSRSEAFPNAVLEAMAAGLPIVASRTGGIVELIDEGRTGVLVPPEDPGALASAMCRLMDDPSAAAAMGSAARAEAAARYSFERMVAGFEQVYLGELHRHRSSVFSRASAAPIAGRPSVG